MRKIELLLALFGTAICLGGVYWAWRFLPSPPYIAHDAILPYLYLMEMAVAAALGLAGVVADAPNRSLRYGWVPWCVAGVILAFAALGASCLSGCFSKPHYVGVGFCLVPWNDPPASHFLIGRGLALGPES